MGTIIKTSRHNRDAFVVGKVNGSLRAPFDKLRVTISPRKFKWL